jgi:hypothetical protein
MFVQEMEIVLFLINAIVYLDGLEIIVNFQFAMELTPPIHPFAIKEDLVFSQIIVLAILVTQETIVNTLFVMEFQINYQVFVLQMEIV